MRLTRKELIEERPLFHDYLRSISLFEERLKPEEPGLVGVPLFVGIAVGLVIGLMFVYLHLVCTKVREAEAEA